FPTVDPEEIDLDKYDLDSEPVPQSPIEIRTDRGIIALWGRNAARIAFLICLLIVVSVLPLYGASKGVIIGSRIIVGGLVVIAFCSNIESLVAALEPAITIIVETGSGYTSLWPVIGGFIIPLILVFAPPGIVYQLEYLQEDSTFRRWFIYGRGGSARW